ncbi:MAG: spermidine synthase [Bosea sp. (in: a-proteobacteria)]
MLPWITLDMAKIPGGGELKLKQRGREFSIMLGSNELMNSRVSGSEQALARLACERLIGRARPRVLIGGLGMGFTLRAALDALPSEASITVAELVPAVIAWARGPMAEVFGASLDDPRVSVGSADVRRSIADATATYDAILLDVDNGPDGLTTGSNGGLYDPVGLGLAKAALTSGGILAVWSAHPDVAFARRLKNAGFVCEEKRVRANGSGGGAKHVIWLATRAA